MLPLGHVGPGHRRRRDAATAVLDELGIRYLLPQGAFYLWVQLPGADRTSRV